MSQLANIKLNNIELPNHNASEVSIDEANKIKGSGPLTWAGAGVGAISGGISGGISYPASEGWEYLTTGQSDYTLEDHGGSIVGGATAGATLGSGIGKAIESLGGNDRF